MNKETKQLGWEEEFEDKWLKTNQFLLIEKDTWAVNKESIKSFISNLLSQERNRILEEVRCPHCLKNFSIR